MPKILSDDEARQVQHNMGIVRPAPRGKRRRGRAIATNMSDIWRMSKADQVMVHELSRVGRR